MREETHSGILARQKTSAKSQDLAATQNIRWVRSNYKTVILNMASARERGKWSSRSSWLNDRELARQKNAEGAPRLNGMKV